MMPLSGFWERAIETLDVDVLTLDGRYLVTLPMAYEVTSGFTASATFSQWVDKQCGPDAVASIHSGTGIVWVDGREKWRLEITAKAQSDGGCPTCGKPGKFVRTALVCEKHGLYGGF